MNKEIAYGRLEALFERLNHLAQAQGMLQWDMAAMMPVGGADSRAHQLATLTTVRHEMLTGALVKDLLAAAEGEPLDDWQRANLTEMHRDWLHASVVPADLVSSFSHACSACEMVWRKARPAADFAMVAESLAAVVRLTREIAAIKSQALALTPYDALLDQYEPGGRAADIDAVFAELELFLPGFLQEVMAAQAPAPSLPAGPFPIDRQKALGERLMRALGFDFDHGRLDVSAHPFCGGTPDDVRLTTRYDERSFIKSLMGVLHETGHALYEQGLPAAWRHQPVGRARSMSVHESQSLLVEMQACRSPEFFAYLAPLLAETFGGDWDGVALRAANVRVEPGFIRVDADEVTYPAHVILRYRLEKALVAGELDVAGLPSAWNEGMTALIGLTPPDDGVGCLQDIHWFDGAIGYFPTYTLGAMTAAQLFEAAGRAVPTLMADIGRGDFTPLLAWLRANVHGHASSLSINALLIEATGRPLDASVFKDHLRRRYLR
jgi:carboxypeptidase Taq